MISQLPAIRSAVRPFLEKMEAGDRIVVAVSGGADSLALAYAVSMEVKKLALQLSAVTINHQLQDKSSDQAATVVEQMKTLGVECTIEKIAVEITDGLESSARRARYEALDRLNAAAIFLGHTHNDQAETVLLGLSRGSGTRSLSGMAEVNGKYIRPFLTITREQTEQACAEIGLTPWNDPHNKDSQFARVRVRTQALPVLEETIGPGISDALVRSAQILRDDADALDQWAEQEILGLDLHDLDCTYLQGLPKAIRSRIIRRAIYAAGAPSGSLTAEHVGAVEALICAWNGQGPAHLPGGVKVERFSGRLSLLRHQL
ncbi:MAG: tRNA lysidine(34) synthetase TilS [Actinobacteria bacterium]|uniref:tRNA(Ile)-lysidine synthetase n=1 Tax=freshwater metagenome TaxID=449393 RepID=A0A6J7W2J4_9ZZZZ|nr:tRNA lysidine(34) synthetase TilS [Actinomycetota bacterium]MSX71761.1 tRNA lysidine(34) synthetase TilS [Actinomycetota bacterium]MSY69664.1 tRNA lysidine(34) synthetase TilS [Actinomycetota bacterium]MTA75936.1 tRNA lysidine(34) synthetase TilS [Actinomycetota bacterium]